MPYFSFQFSLSTPDFGGGKHDPPDQHHSQEPSSSHRHSQDTEKQRSSGIKTAASGNATTNAGSIGSYSTLRNKFKSVQERCRSSVTNRLKAKITGKGANNSSATAVDANNMTSSNRFRSHSYGALHSLNEFEERQMEETDQGNHEDEETDTFDEQDSVASRNKTTTTWLKSSSNQVTTSATIEAPPKSVSSNSSTSSSPRLTSDILPLHGTNPVNGHHDQDSGILNEAGSDSLSSGSDSGFYHTVGSGSGSAGGENAPSKAASASSSAGQSSPRYSVCSSRCSSSDSDGTVKVKSQGTETADIKRVGRFKKRIAASSASEAKAIERRHSRASSVDRREIFKKYIQNATASSEHTPYANDNPELLGNTNSNSRAKKPAAATPKQQLHPKEFRLVRLHNPQGSDLGIFIARNKGEADSSGYFVAYILPDGLVKR